MNLNDVSNVSHNYKSRSCVFIIAEYHHAFSLIIVSIRLWTSGAFKESFTYCFTRS